MLIQWKVVSLVIPNIKKALQCGGWLSQGGWGGKRKVGLGILLGALAIR